MSMLMIGNQRAAPKPEPPRRGLTFGEFDLKAGVVYTLRIVPGPGFGAIAVVSPQLVIEYFRRLR